jgi:hypothetical protein
VSTTPIDVFLIDTSKPTQCFMRSSPRRAG